MKDQIRFVLLSLLILSLGACAPARFVKPLRAKEHALCASFGGPLLKYSGLTIPVPLLTAGYGYGIDSSLTAFGALNLTSLAFGNAQIDAGITKQLFSQDGLQPSVSVSPVVNIIYRNSTANKFYPQLDLNAFWEYGKRKNFFYAGISNWFELSGSRIEGPRQPNHWLFTPQAGHTFTFRRASLSVETKVIAPHLSNDKTVVDYQTPFGTHGAFGVYVSYTYHIK